MAHAAETERRQIAILDPTATRVTAVAAPTVDVGGPIRGRVVGLRLDHAWRSYMTVVDVWSQRLTEDGATPLPLWIANRVVGEEGEKTRTALNEWSNNIDVGVVGLGN